MKVGDPVLCYKTIWLNNEWMAKEVNIRGIIIDIKWYPGLNNSNVHFYVIRSNEETFNIFPQESIILDKQTLREEKLKELGIL